MRPLIRPPAAATFSCKGRRLSLVALLLLIPTLALAQPKFPPLTGRVVDDANLLSPAAEQKLTDELAALEQKTGRQLVVATLPTLQGYEIEDYGYQLLRTWGIGRKDQDDGVILIVAPKEKKVRIEVGYGLEPVLTDAVSSLIIQRAILPPFKEGQYEAGVVAGTEQIVAQLGLSPEEAEAQAMAAITQQSSQAPDNGEPPWTIIVSIFIFLWLISGVMRAFGARRRFGGSGLWWLLPMILSNSGGRDRGGWSSGGGGSWGGGGGGGFSGGGGSGGGGGASGSW